MNSHKIIILGVLFMVTCAPFNARAVDQNSDSKCTNQMQRDKDSSQVILDLRDTLRDKEKTQLLLRDRARIHNMLKQPELRQEMLLHPRFIRRMMQIGDIRQELLENEQMIHELLRNRVTHREVVRNSEMMEEIEKNEKYRCINQDQEADILEDLLLEPTVSGPPSPHHMH